MENYNNNAAYSSGANTGEGADQRKMYPDYCGPNTVSKYYRAIIISAVIIMAIAVPVAFILRGKNSFWNVRAPYLLVIFVILIVYSLVQFLYYRKVVLTYVQDVVPTADPFKTKNRKFKLRVVCEGKTIDVKTQGVFSLFDEKQYAGKQHIAGYDAKRKHWIIL